MHPMTLNDAYTQWLGISAAELPPHHYRLLGVPLYESNPQTILSAYSGRTAQLSSHLSGDAADVAHKLLGQLAAAQACLLDVNAKREYDRTLEAKHGATQRSDGVGPVASGFHRPSPRAGDPQSHADSSAPPSQIATVSPPPISAPAAVSAGGAVSAPPRKSDADQPMTALPWLIGGVCTGLLGVGVLAMILFATRDRDEPPVAVNHSGPANTIVNRSSPPPRDRQNAKRPALSTTNRHNREHVAPPTVAPDRLKWDKEPQYTSGGELLNVDELNNPAPGNAESAGDVGTPAEEADPPDESPAPVKSLANLPRAFALPRAANGAALPAGPTVLTRVDVNNPRDVHIELVSHVPAGGSGRYTVQPRDDTTAEDENAPRVWEVQHQSDGGEPKHVGEYTLADGELSFAWSPEADPEQFAQLENQPLKITAGEETTTIAQRVADDVAPITVQVDAGAVGTTVAIDNPPEQARVAIAIDELGDEFGDYFWEGESMIAVGKSSMLRFGDENDRFQFALQVSAEEAGPNRVRIETRPMFRPSTTKKWDYFRPRKMSEALASFQQQQTLLDAQFQQLQDRYRRNPVALEQATALHNQQSAALLENIANLQRINDRCQELQDQAQLHFRVIADNGEESIDLVRTTADEAADVDVGAEPAGGEAEVPDERIGPPDPADADPAGDPNIGPPEAETVN